MAGSLGSGEKNGEDVAVEGGGGGRGVIGGRYIPALLPLSPLPVPIHGVRVRRGGVRGREAARARWEMMMAAEVRVACIGGV